MKAIVLGVGFQGKAVIHDLSQSPIIDKIIAVDIDLSSAAAFLERGGYQKVCVIKKEKNSLLESRSIKKSRLTGLWDGWG